MNIQLGLHLPAETVSWHRILIVRAMFTASSTELLGVQEKVKMRRLIQCIKKNQKLISSLSDSHVNILVKVFYLCIG